MYSLNGKCVAITGVCGTIGSALLKKLLEPEYGVATIVGLDNNESEIAALEGQYREEPRVGFFVADVRDKQSVVANIRGTQILFHCAAFKHVNLCERSPMEAVKTNVLGVETIISASHEAGVERVIFTSSDKAVHPVSVMGMTKLLGESLAFAAGRSQSDPTCIITRFGNVLGSSGSVVPIFIRQINCGGPITITDDRMTRFVMSLEQAVSLVIDAAKIGSGGEIFVTKMPALRLVDLSQALIQEMLGDDAAVPTTSIGARPGEKLHEELMTPLECMKAVELEDYFVILPEGRSARSLPGVKSQDVTMEMRSENSDLMTVPEIRLFLRDQVIGPTSG